MTDNQPQHQLYHQLLIGMATIYFACIVSHAHCPLIFKSARRGVLYHQQGETRVGWWHTMWGERILAVTPDSGDCGSPHQKLYPWSNKNKIRNQISAAQVTPADELLMNTLLCSDSDGGHICGISVWMSAYRADNLGLTSPYLIPELPRHPHTAPVSSCRVPSSY